MKIQSLSFTTPVRKPRNIGFCSQQRIKLSELKDVIENSPEEKSEILENVPRMRYFYLGADDEAHETTAPFVTKQTEFGDRLYIIRSGKPRAFSGFTIEKDDKKDECVIYDSGYPSVVDDYEDGELKSTTHYDPETHQVVEY